MSNKINKTQSESRKLLNSMWKEMQEWQGSTCPQWGEHDNNMVGGLMCFYLMRAFSKARDTKEDTESMENDLVLMMSNALKSGA